MQEVYNSFASTYWEAIGATEGVAKNINSLVVGDNLTGAVIDVSSYTVGETYSGYGSSPYNYKRIIKGTSTANGDYLQLLLEGYNAAQYGTNYGMQVILQHLAADNSVINSVVLLNCFINVDYFQPSGVYTITITAINQRKNTQLLQIDDIDFGEIQSIQTINGGFLGIVIKGVSCIMSPTTPEALVNIPYLRSKIGYSAEAEIELGEAGEYTSEALWLRSGFIVRELKAVMANSNGQTRGIAADKISFNPAAKTITITADEDLTGWTAKAQVIYDVNE